MNVSRSSATRIAVLALLLVTSGCKTTTPTSGFELLAPMALREPMPPSELDRAVTALAAAALAGDQAQMDASLARVETLHDDEAIERAKQEHRPEMKGLVPLCIDLKNSTLDDPVAYREASKELLDSWSLHPDPALKARLQQAVNDDPLKLASERTWDYYESLFATTFNTVAEPVGGSLMWGVAIAPFRLASSLTHYAASMYSQPEISLQERQALAHRKQYLAEYPDASDAPAVREKVDDAQEDLDEMQAKHYVEKSWDALSAGKYWLAEMEADRALLVLPGDSDAVVAASIAQDRRRHHDELLTRSDTASPGTPDDLEPEALEALALRGDQLPLRGLLEALLASSKRTSARFDENPADTERDAIETERLYRVIDELRLLQEADPEGELADEAAYVLALAQYDLGFEIESWKKLQALAHEENTQSNMARHARSLLQDPWQNTYGNFERQKHRATQKEIRFRLFGGMSFGNRYDLPLGMSYLVELPNVAQALLTAPLRLVFGAWEPKGTDFKRPAATAGYRYLKQSGEGQHTREVAKWLYEYEVDRDNWVGAMSLYDLQPETDPTERIALSEKAASQQLAAADRAARRDWRGSILRGVVREYPDSDAGETAGFRLRQELEMLAPQRIRVTRSFFKENPHVAGPRGLALNPTLLDDDLRNGELHPMGVTLLGGRVIEIALVPESGDKDDPPFTVRERIDAERLSHTVALLDETVLMNDQIDELDAVQPDAFRDAYLERARLGLVNDPDMRASAESDYVYESLREQYGMVRGRDSILPFDLVFQGSLFDMSLGAFPRWRQPRETPDAFLYR